MEKNKCFFSFGKINKYFIIPFLCPIFCFLKVYFTKLYVKIPNENDIENKIKNKIYLISSTDSLSYFGGGLLYFISYIRSRTKQQKESNENKKERANSEGSISSSSIDYIYNDPLEKKSALKIFSILFFMSFLVIFGLIGNLFTINKNVFEKRLYYLLLLPFFSKIILKSELFKHQILSLFISIIGIILLFIPISLKIQKSDILYNILIFFISTARSFIFVMVKLLTHKYFLSPYFCLFYIGFFSLIILLVGFIIFYLIKDHNLDNFIRNFRDEDLLSVTYLILTIIFTLINNVLSFLVIFYFSPTLLMVTDIIHPIIKWIISLFKNEKEYKILDIILNSIGYSLVLFFSLIYNEIIIFNFFGLNRKTIKYLDEKQREETSSIIDNFDDEDNNIDGDAIELKKEID